MTIPSDPMSGKRRVAAPAESGVATHVLLIEDDPVQRADAWGILEALGYSVMISESAEEGFLLLRQYSFGLILTDNVLPGITALQALPRMKATGIPIVVMSSQGNADMERDALLLGAAAFVKKPLSPSSLSRVLRSVHRGSDAD